MKKWSVLILSMVVLALAASGALVAEPADQGDTNRIYYLTRETAGRGGDILQPSDEALRLPGDATVTEAAVAVVERLLAGPEDGSLLSPMPKGVRLLSLKVKDRRAYVDLSEEFTRLSGVELTLADYCLTLSLTALEGINAVAVTAQGRPVGQQPKRVLFERDVLLSTMDDVLKTVPVSLYFPGSDGVLVEERRVLEIYEGQTVSENLIDALLAGPENRELQTIIPEDFVVNSVRVDSGVCSLNLSAASLAALPEDEGIQRSILESLARSLYSINTVRELRLLADGQELTRFGQISLEELANMR